MNKLRFWRQLPYVMIGISHPSEDLARECCKRGLALWISAPNDVSHHRVTRLLFSGVMFQAIVRFAAGCARDCVEPIFGGWAARFAAAFVIERPIEAKHALMKAGVRSTSKVSEVYASLFLRLSGLMARLKQSSSGAVMEQLVHYSNLTRTP